jgi:ribosome biogenesis GTPase
MARRRLTDRQKDRIAKIQETRRRRLAARVDSALEDAERTQHPGQQSRPGRVITRHGRNLVIEDDHGELRHCLFRQNLGEVVCGDRVVWQPTGEGEGVVTALIERETALSRPDYSGRDRPLAANITQLVIVLAPEPRPSGYLLDQYLVAAELIGVRALITLNKADLLDASALASFRARFAPYREIGYPLLTISARTEHGLDPLIERLRDQTSILVGQSGVGKSSLLNALVADQSVQVGRLSQATGLGRHTTSAATLYRLPSGGELIDSPGVRSFRLGQLDQPTLELGFREIRPHIGHCRFSNCTHDQEPGCAIRKAIGEGKIAAERLDSFQHMRRRMAGRISNPN